MNPLQFSWANTLIDPTSVDLRFRSHEEELEVLDTTYPHDKRQMLYWNVRSELDGDALVEITYFTSGISWAADYTCISDPAEATMSFEGFVRIANGSGEDYADAQVRLVVGEINLVEEVRDLAARGIIAEGLAQQYLAERDWTKLEERARGQLLDRLSGRMAPASGGIGGAAPKEIVKEGLSEYFIYTIEGTETVLFEGERVPFEIVYRYRPMEYGDQLVRLFILRNDEKSKLGTTPLPDGTVRLFRDNGRDGLSYLTSYQTKYVPIGQEIELNLGRDPEVVHELIRVRSWRDGFWFQEVEGRKYFDMSEEKQIRHDYPVAGWIDHEAWVERIRNDREKAIEVELRRSFDGHVELGGSGLGAKLHDYRTVELKATVPASERKDLAYEVGYRQGILHEQNNVTIK
jgi:hypothetical protein